MSHWGRTLQATEIARLRVTNYVWLLDDLRNGSEVRIAFVVAKDALRSALAHLTSAILTETAEARLPAGLANEAQIVLLFAQTRDRFLQYGVVTREELGELGDVLNAFARSLRSLADPEAPAHVSLAVGEAMVEAADRVRESQRRPVAFPSTPFEDELRATGT